MVGMRWRVESSMSCLFCALNIAEARRTRASAPDPEIGQIRAVGQQPASVHEIPMLVHGRNAVACRELDELPFLRVEHRRGEENESIGPRSGDRSNSGRRTATRLRPRNPDARTWSECGGVS